jgi:glycosyltransferase involved in cell wall biosynthesis
MENKDMSSELMFEDVVIDSNTRLVVLYDRLGPYHHARLSALSHKIDLIAIEFSLTDETYGWDLIQDFNAYRRVTLFSDKPIGMYASKTVSTRVKNVLDELNPHVVVIPGWDAPAALIALQWCLETGTPSVLLSDSQKSDQKRVWWKEFVKGRIVQLHSTGFVGGSQHITYLESLGMPKSRIFAGCDVVDNDYFAAAAEAARLEESTRGRLGLPRAYFLASGRFVEKKNLPLLLQAYANYCTTVGDSAWSLVLIGDGPLKPQLLQLRQDLGLVNKVILPGFKQYTELPAFYALAGAFVHTSTSEQWGLVINEAMACSLPVIVSSPCGCVPELIQHGRNGFIFNPDDLNELSRYLAYIASAECDRQTMGEASRDIIGELSPDSYADNLCRAAVMALATPKHIVNFFDNALLWGLIHR